MLKGLKKMKPQLITREGLAREAPDRWREQYQGWEDDKIKMDILRQLDAAAKAPSFNADLVDCIIGNKSWTTVECDACGRKGLDRAVIVGQEMDYGSRTATLCEACCREALDMFSR